MSNSAPKLHNAMWPGLVGKGDGPGQEPAISLERMLELTAAASVNGQDRKSTRLNSSHT